MNQHPAIAALSNLPPHLAALQLLVDRCSCAEARKELIVTAGPLALRLRWRRAVSLLRVLGDGWPRLMRLSTAAAYLDMTTASFLGEVGRGSLPAGMMFAGRERWDRHAIDAALDQPLEDNWRRHQPGLAEADPTGRIIDRSR